MQWKSILSTTPLVLFWLPNFVGTSPVSPSPSPSDKGKGDKIQAPTRPKTYSIVYRGDNRSPAEIRSLGGFLPVGSYWEDDINFNMYRHMAVYHGRESARGETDSDTAFVSAVGTAAEIEYASTWHYVIAATPNMLSPELSRQTLTLALGGIHWSQVLGWHEVRDAQGRLTQLADRFFANPDYNSLIFSMYTSTVATNDWVWHASSQLEWIGRMQQLNIGTIVGFRDTFPLEFGRYALNPSIPGPRPETQAQRPLSPPISIADSLDESDVEFVAGYLQENPPTCDLDDLEPEPLDLTVRTDGALARAASVIQYAAGPSGLQRPNQSLQGEVARLAAASAPASCDLVAQCLAPRRESQKRATDDARLRTFCTKIQKFEHQGHGQVCRHVKDLEFHFKIFEWYYSGTYSRTRAVLAGPSGKTSFDIAEQTLSGLNVTIPVDVEPFGSDTLDLNNPITNITIETQAHWYQTNDKFEIESIILRGECVETGFPVEVTKFQEMEEGKYLSQSDGSDNHEPGWNAAITYNIDPSDWRMRPSCVYIDHLEFDSLVGNDIYSPGTYDNIFLTIGESKQIPLAEAPWGGTAISSTVDLREHFGFDELPVAALKAMTVIDTTGTSPFSNDEWEVGGITLKARCSGSGAMIKMPKFEAVKEAVRHRMKKKDEIVWRDNFGPADWINM